MLRGIYVPWLFYPSTDGHLGCFHILLIVNNTAVNRGLPIVFQVSVLGFFGCIPRSELWVIRVVLFLVVLGTSILFSIVAAPVCILTNSAQGFPSLHILAGPVVCSFIDDNHSDRCGVSSHCGFNLVQ